MQLSQLPKLPEPPELPELPSDEDLVEALLGLAVPFEEVNGLLSARTRLDRDRGLRTFFEEMLRTQAEAVGTLGRPAGLDRDWAAWTAGGEGLATLLFVALAPLARAHHRALGIPAEVTGSTLADLGRQLAVSRWRGRTGLGNARWLTLHFRGELFQLGRLQFQRTRPTGADAPAARAGGADGWSLQLHIPDHCGPLSPAACDRALDRARAFFPRHFPGEPYRSCHIFSWLLDPQLADRLPAESNIVRFQRRFSPLERPDLPNLPDLPSAPEDSNPLKFVFGDIERPLESLPRDTVLQRALVDHLRAGGHWYVRGGRLPLE
ncbi:acyltransferase domain-containing protein [Kitasatospora purpeofusca]|uniref:acyltransferase domain-containing protein n=1 Tax=Kitasatospora purpeofusca TaxID=67352 RepID=UPI002253A57E|nr:acyltransferase domain-containing protein [Kitasatospora purpeofusca]MCX4759396.1 acyltransferase domain-containing protein [Kitasatospora purpeofusca]WSR30214.1 acyltransferase domain-containing protein [Kitasatospora purpeofusca]WSR38449.1 acyltransferase domain-containing protein [Kitasatospora purpeofusca]